MYISFPLCCFFPFFIFLREIHWKRPAWPFRKNKKHLSWVKERNSLLLLISYEQTDEATDEKLINVPFNFLSIFGDVNFDLLKEISKKCDVCVHVCWEIVFPSFMLNCEKKTIPKSHTEEWKNILFIAKRHKIFFIALCSSIMMIFI